MDRKPGTAAALGAAPFYSVNAEDEMKDKLIAGVLIPLLILGAGCSLGPGLAPEVEDQGQRLARLEGQLSSMQGQVGEMSTSIAGLTVRLESLAEVAEGHDSSFEIAMAQFVLDTAGFHAMSEALAAGNPIDPTSLAAVDQVQKVLASTELPEELRPAVDAFLVSLSELQAALEADDSTAAASLAARVHDQQHELSRQFDLWLGTGADHGHGEG